MFLGGIIIIVYFFFFFGLKQIKIQVERLPTLIVIKMMIILGLFFV